MGLFDAGSLLQAGTAWFGAELQNRRQSDAAATANSFSADQFAHRYQTTVSDMQAAGLNPMLAYSQGGGSPPSGQQANVPANSGASAVAGYNAAKLNSAQVDLLKAQEHAASAQAAKTEAETPYVARLGESTIGYQGASASKAEADVKLINATVSKVIEETKNIPYEGNRIRAVAEQLLTQADLNYQKSSTESVVREQLRSIIGKLKKETELLSNQAQVEAALENWGRGARELKPFADLVRSLLIHK